MVCSKCGQDNQPGVNFCMACGAPIAPAPPVTAQEPGGKKPFPKWLKIGGFGCGGLLLLIVAITIFGIMLQKKALQELGKADSLWQSGNKEAAVEIYKKQIKSGVAGLKNKMPIVYGRVIEYEIERGESNSARKYVEEALDKKISLSMDSEKGKKLLAEVEAERAAKEREKEEEKAKREAAKEQQAKREESSEPSKEEPRADTSASAGNESASNSSEPEKVADVEPKCKDDEEVAIDVFTRKKVCRPSEAERKKQEEQERKQAIIEEQKQAELEKKNAQNEEKQFRREAESGPAFSLAKRNPDRFIGQKVAWKGKVLRIEESGGISTIQVDPRGGSFGDSFVFQWNGTVDELNEGTVIKVYGVVAGQIQTTNMMGGTITPVVVDATYYDYWH